MTFLWSRVVLEGWTKVEEGILEKAVHYVLPRFCWEILNCYKGNWSRVGSRRILSNITAPKYITTYLQENS